MKHTNPGRELGWDPFIPLAVLYLLIPNLIFLTTWLRPAIGIPAALMVMVCAGFLMRDSGRPFGRRTPDRTTLGFVVMMALVWTFLAGVGGFIPQSTDYLKHNLVFHDLISLAWPISYDAPATGKNYLCYGLAYYLAPAFVARRLGEGWLPGLIFLWTAFGVGLFFYWIATLNDRPKTTLLILLFFSVTSGFWFFFKRHTLPGLAAVLEHMGLINTYFDNFTRLYYQPQHAIAGWLGAALAYDLLWLRKNPQTIAFVLALLLLWSVLSLIGLLLLPLAAFKRVRLADYFTPINLLGGGTLAVLLGLYYQGHVPLMDRGPIWTLCSGAPWLLLYLLFLVLLLSPVLLVHLIDRKYGVLGEARIVFRWAAVLLMLTPLYKIGYFGDLRMQSAAPALVYIALAVSGCLTSQYFSLRRPLFLLLSTCLLVGATYPIGRILFNLSAHRDVQSYAQISQSKGFHNLSDIREAGFDAASQYLGKSESLAARWLLK